MENTCSENCFLWKKYKKRCPNYVESLWNPNKGKPILIKDCAPKRTFLMIQELYNKLEGVQQSQEQQRNATMPIFKLIKTQIEKKLVE